MCVESSLWHSTTYDLFASPSPNRTSRNTSSSVGSRRGIFNVEWVYSMCVHYKQQSHVFSPLNRDLWRTDRPKEQARCRLLALSACQLVVPCSSFSCAGVAFCPFFARQQRRWWQQWNTGDITVLTDWQIMKQWRVEASISLEVMSHFLKSPSDVRLYVQTFELQHNKRKRPSWGTC